MIIGESLSPNVCLPLAIVNQEVGDVSPKHRLPIGNKNNKHCIKFIVG
jgi:hypothetical protein